MISILKLFKAVPVTSKKRKKATKRILETTIKRGFILAPEVINKYSEDELHDLALIIEKELFLSGEQLNASFHKSWQKIKDASIEQLVMEQLVHYFTTYGFEELGIYSKESVYIPNEKLEVPILKSELDMEGISLVVIKGYTKEEIKEKLMNMLQSGIALKEDTMEDILEVAKYVKINEKDIELIKNKEIKVRLYDKFNIVPENPVEFLRYVIFMTTGGTLLIKDKATIEKITTMVDSNIPVIGLFNNYKNKYGLEKLATIFYRFKPLWLAFKTTTQLNTIINKIRKLAKIHHKPMPEDYLNEVTAKIKKGETISKVKLISELSKVTTFRKIRLLYALKFRTTNDAESIMYKIRNGKAYATKTEEYNSEQKTEAKRTLDIVKESIINDMSKNVKGKKIFIPEHVRYTLPATEKQFTGYFPSGSCITIPKDMVFGVHWENVEHNRIDLDLSLINPETGKIGWDSDYRTEDTNILFSGDITDAAGINGASELFYIKRQTMESYIMIVNYYNYNKEVEVPFDIIVAKEQVNNLKKNYMVNPNNVMSIAKASINQRQKVLGLIVTTTGGCKFYFTETYLGRSITSSGNEFVENARKYLFDFYQNTISLNDILKKAGAEMVEDKKDCDIDLSPENLEKDSILNLLSINKKKDVS